MREKMFIMIDLFRCSKHECIINILKQNKGYFYPGQNVKRNAF